MFRQIREEYGLTRSQLSDLTGRTPNYLLKAEALTFPSPPVSLLDLYTGGEPKDWGSLSEVEWEAMDRDILISQYRDSQRYQRELWLELVDPMPNKAESFCRQWVFKPESPNDLDYVTPTEYRVSQGLCVPAPAVYRAEKFGHVSAPMRIALADLVDYVASGRYTAKHLSNEAAAKNVDGVIRIAYKYGVGVTRERAS